MEGREVEVVRTMEHWRLFLGGIGYGIWERAIKAQTYGRHSTPGSIDTQQAIYLACCDEFVTADRKQRKMLRQVSVFGHQHRPVISCELLRESFPSVI
jgi:hypothetical protein